MRRNFLFEFFDLGVDVSVVIVSVDGGVDGVDVGVVIVFDFLFNWFCGKF